ncbi:MAG: DsbA family protein [Thermoproteota archaeon]|nr:DsbA family protein [Thermoproteota archaeon]
MNRKKSSFQRIRCRKVFIILGIIFAVIMVAGTLAGTMSSKIGLSNLSQQHSLQSQSASALIQKLSSPTTPNAPALGSSNAPVTLIEFGDYQCTFCHRFHVDTKDLILANFVKNGKVRFLFKDFPINDLPADRASTLASEASYCAADQGKYWQYYNELYNQWKGENTGWVTKDSLKQFATSVGVKDINQFSQCLESGKYAGVVADNLNLGQSIGLNATPTFVLLANNEKQQPLEIVGAQPYSVFANAINQIASVPRHG